MEIMQYGFFSNEAVSKGVRTFIYRRPDGSEVEVIGVALDKEGTGYGWDDKVCVGPVGGFIRPGRLGTNIHIYDNE